MQIKDANVVLAHGAWADGSSWGPVILGLRRLGAKVWAAPLPLTSLSSDVEALDRTIKRTEGPTILVGHAYAGAVIAETRSENVKALVYITGLAPDEGEKVADVFYRTDLHPNAPQLAPDADGMIWLPGDAFGKAFAQHASADQLAVLAAVQRPISIDAITTPVKRPLWKDVPSWFLVAEEDRMIVPETQRFMAERMRAHVQAARLDHLPMLTATDVVVEIIADAFL